MGLDCKQKFLLFIAINRGVATDHQTVFNNYKYLTSQIHSLKLTPNVIHSQNATRAISWRSQMISGSGLMHWRRNCERNSSSFLCSERYSVKMMSKHFYILKLCDSRKRMWCPHGEPSDAKLLLMQFEAHGPLIRYVKLRVVHAPTVPGTFSPPLTSKETAS